MADIYKLRDDVRWWIEEVSNNQAKVTENIKTLKERVKELINAEEEAARSAK